MEAEATPVRDLLGLEGVGSPIDDTLKTTTKQRLYVNNHKAPPPLPYSYS